jgi:isoaspartyl peptidase/L-asparaginase-like protein (Ntn-hydrolase superfamily)
MSYPRRRFLQLVSLSAAFLAGKNAWGRSVSRNSSGNGPIVLSTWDHGLAANEAAWKILAGGGRALDAVEAGVRVPEADPNVQSVGYGGLPDRDGRVTLDACIMDERSGCGSVAFLEHIIHPISVARLVMEKTPHVMLVGEGALKFALDNGFTKENLLTEQSRKAWEAWLKTSEYKPVVNWENHDTIGMIALDVKGDLSGACTTSGMAYKLHGRVGDSPIIGAGLFVDNEVGAATSTGVGEEVIRICGSHLVVELMRQGHAPEAACRIAVERIVRNQPKKSKEIQVGFLALNKHGEYGAYCLQTGFNYAIMSKDVPNSLFDGKAYYKS